MATKNGNVGEEGAWVDCRDQWYREGREEKEEVMRYRARVAALERSMVRGGQSDEVWMRRLEGLTVRGAEAASSLLSKHG